MTRPVLPSVQRVLIVDDEFSIRMLLARIMKTWGYEVRHVGSALEALAAMESAPPDVLLCDVQMPDHDGLWLLAQVRARWPQIRVVMATGTQDADVIATSRRLGAVAYVTKPFVRYRLREALDAAAGRRH